MSNFPELALSVRQPWAWAIIHGGKDIENRSIAAVSHGLSRRGRYAIHASSGMTRQEYLEAKEFMRTCDGIGIPVPPAHELRRGGIIGSITVIDVIKESDNPWFFGPRGLVLRDPVPCNFIPCIGALGYFEWHKGAVGIVRVVQPARWMLPPHVRMTDGPDDELKEATFL